MNISFGSANKIDIEKIIDKLSGLTIVPELYKDLPQPIIQKIATAIGYAMDFVFIPLKGLKFISSFVDLHLDHNLKKIAQKLEDIPEDKIIPVPPEISIPILQKLTYTTNEDIANLFISLMSKAANSETVNQAHPSFITVIERMSADEAKIIKFLSGQRRSRFPYYEVFFENIVSKEQNKRIKYLTDIDIYVPLDFPENSSFYISNLITLGFLQDGSPKQILYPSVYQTLEAVQNEKINQYRLNETEHHKLILSPSFLDVTEFGSQFIRSCFG